MKENNGRAALERRLRLCGMGMTAVVVILLVTVSVSIQWSRTQTEEDLVVTQNDKQHVAAHVRQRQRHAAFRQKQHENKQSSPGILGKAMARLTHHQPNTAEDQQRHVEAILRGELHLMDITPQRRTGMTTLGDDNQNYHGWFQATFCRLNWTAHEHDPSQSPMFRDVVAQSQCDTADNPKVSLDLYTIVQAIREYDTGNSTTTKTTVAQLSGFVFHESRCGSTLVANLLQLHSPTQNIVYSESTPLIAVLTSLGPLYLQAHPSHKSARLLAIVRDVVHVMSRTNVATKRRVFFKVQSIGSWYLSLMRAAFPSTPWIYVYRDPVEVIMSHLKVGARANCVRSQSRGSDIPHQIQAVIQRRYVDEPQSSSSVLQTAQQLSLPQYCAAHLASLTESAVTDLHQPSSEQLGVAVNYRDLPQILWDTIWPQSWNLTVHPTDDDPDVWNRLQQGSHSYSKQGARQRIVPNKNQPFVQDSSTKQAQASQAVQDAARLFLQPSYQQLQDLAESAKTTTKL